MNPISFEYTKKLLLAFQLEEYIPLRFLKHIRKNPFVTTQVTKRALVWTPKAKQIYIAAVISFILFAACVIKNLPLLEASALILAGIIYFHFFLIIGWSVRRPYEIANRIYTKKRLNNIVTSMPHLQIIGITGSYGKTSTKLILEQLMSKRTLSTPKSFNKLFGIDKVIDYELDKKHEFFICEMGAYKKGEIKELCETFPPDISILTGINEQHLDRFKTIGNTIKAKFEILENLKPNGLGIINLDNEYIRKNLSNIKRSDIKLIGYTLTNQKCNKCEKVVGVKSWYTENNKIQFILKYNEKEYLLNSNLIGKAHLQNTVAAIIAAMESGEDIKYIRSKLNNVKQIKHRLEVKPHMSVTIIDDTYSSNPTGFKNALDVLAKYKNRVLITPGIVELGKKSISVHTELGKYASDKCEQVLLVQKNRRTEALRSGLISNGFSRKDIKFISNQKNLYRYVEDNIPPESTVLLENELPD